jgi:small-conductance mechanosensitive channel
LVKLFRPDREGNLTMLDFVKSIDAVYKDFRLLSASIENSTQIDRAFENIFNIGFYAVVITVTLSQLGFDPLALFLSLSSVILAFAFAIGSASAKYFEGVLFILVRRPYSIGDRVHVSNVEADTSFDGSPGWVVENVTLFETTVIWGPTNERASLSNGSLANSRIINLARSPQAQLFIYLKIPIDTSYEKILIFKSAVEEYMKARPREWLALNGFRANRIAADLGWTEYLIIIQHRESWQEVGQVLDSKANLSSYCQEVAKQLNIHYKAPPLPVNLKYAQAASPEEVLESSDAIDTDLDSVARTQEFRSMALSKHNIRYS